VSSASRRLSPKSKIAGLVNGIFLSVKTRSTSSVKHDGLKIQGLGSTKSERGRFTDLPNKTANRRIFHKNVIFFILHLSRAKIEAF